MKKTYFIDAHAHTGYFPNLATCEKNILTSIEKFKIDFTLFSFDGSEFNDNENSRKRLVQQIIGFEKAYSFMAKNPYKFGMLCWIRPNTENNFVEVDNFIANHRKSIYGIKVHPYCSKLKIDDSKFIPYFKIAEKYHLPICVHTAIDKYSQTKYLIKVAKIWPQLNFIAAHGELMSNHKIMLKALKECKNIYLDTAWMDMSFITILKNNGFIDRVIFGTDNPINGIDTLNDKIYKNYFNNSIDLPIEDYEKLMWKNALKVYNINPKYLVHK